MYTNILIPTDGSPLAEQAVDKGIALAKALGAKVTVLTVIEPFEVMRHIVVADSAQLNETYAMYEREADAHADRILGSATERASALGVTAATARVQSGYPSDAIIETATAQGADLIMMASHGRKGVAAVLIGSETMKVLTHSRIPVLVLR